MKVLKKCNAVLVISSYSICLLGRVTRKLDNHIEMILLEMKVVKILPAIEGKFLMQTKQIFFVFLPVDDTLPD